MSEKFGRHYNLKLTTQNGTVIEITDPFTLEFNVQKQILVNMSANPCSLRIHNLAKSTRNLIFKDGFTLDQYLGIEFRAGYSELGLLMKANASRAYSVRTEGSTEVITEINGFDGGYAKNNSFSSFTLANGAKKQDVVKRLLSDLKANPTSRMQVGAIGTFDGVHTRGVSVGPKSTIDLLQTWTANKFFINDEKAYCMKDDDCLEGTILTISSDTGLLGSPKRYDFVIYAEILFEPMLQLNQIVNLISTVNSNYNGVYIVKAITHSGIISGAVGGKCKTLVTLYKAPSPNVIQSFVGGGGIFRGAGASGGW